MGYWLGRPIAPVVARANILLFFAASDFFSVVSYSLTGLITSDAIRFSLLVGPVYAIGVLLGAQLFGRASETLFRAICYALIAAAVVIGSAGTGWRAAVIVLPTQGSITRSQYAYPSRSTCSPVTTAIARENIGPATTQV